MKPLILMLAACLTACAGETTKPPAPRVVEVPVPHDVVVTQYVAPPAELTADCKDEAAREQTAAEAKRLALVRKKYLDECTARMKRIRTLAKP